MACGQTLSHCLTCPPLHSFFHAPPQPLQFQSGKPVPTLCTSVVCRMVLPPLGFGLLEKFSGTALISDF